MIKGTRNTYAEEEKTRQIGVGEMVVATQRIHEKLLPNIWGGRGKGRVLW